MNLLERKFLEMLNDRPEVMLIVNPDNGSILKANNSAAVFFGISKNGLESSSIENLRIKKNPDKYKSTPPGFSSEYYYYDNIRQEYDNCNFSVHSFPLIFRDKNVNCITIEKSLKADTRETVRKIPFDKYENFFRHSVIGKALLNTDYTLVEVNDSFCKILGYSAEELKKMKYKDITHPDDIEKGQTLINDVLTGGRDYGAQEKRYIHKDGHTVYAELKLSVIRDIEGTPVNIVAQMLDITDRKNLESLLSESENLYKTVVLSVKEAIILQERSGKIIIWNEGAEKMLGVDENDAVGMNALNREWLTFRPDGTLWHPDEHPSMMTFKTGKPCRGVMMKVKIRETEPFKWISVDTTPISRSGENLPYAVIIAASDITEKIKIQELFMSRLRLLEASENVSIEELLEMTIDEAEKLTDSEIGFFHFVNEDDNTLSLQQWSTNTKKTMCKAVPSESHYPIASAGVWADCVRINEPVIHNDFPNLQGKKGYPEGHAAVLRELTVPVKRGGKSVAIIGVGNKEIDYTDNDVNSVTQIADLAWDIVQKKLSDENLKISERKLRKSNDEKDKLFSIVAHDLRSPFLAFLGMTNLIVENISEMKTTEIDGYLKRMNTAAQNLFILLNNLLEWSVSQRGLCKYLPENHNLSSIVDDTLGGLRENFLKKEIKVVKDVSDSITVYADKTMLQTIFRNLLSNAIKFNRRGGEIRIIANKNSGKHTEIRVEDTGIGMDEEMINSLFDLSVNNKRKGTENEPSTGLGLQICREFVEKNNGAIRVESEIEKGTKFIISLPSENQK